MVQKRRPTGPEKPEQGVPERLQGLERRIARQSLVLLVLAVVVVGVGVGAIVAVESYVPTVRVDAPQGLDTGASATPTTTVPTSPPVVVGVRPAGGPAAGGNQVKIVGLSFDTAQSVTFGDLPAADFTVDPDGQSITAQAPPHSVGVVDVTVTTSRGSSAESPADVYEYLGPSVTRVVPKKGSSGSSVQIVGRELNGASAVEFGGVPAAAFTVNATGSVIIAVAPSGTARTVDVTVTTPGGTSTPTPADRFQYP